MRRRYPAAVFVLAALLAGKVAEPGECLAVVLSGGNVDFDLFASIQEDSA